jgi:1-acyl-sn-glycerol-3-phosphate acyltransferase
VRLPFRRKRSFADRVKVRGRDIGKKAASQLDVPIARSWFVGLARELFMRLVLEPLIDFYTRRRSTGRERLAGVKGPVILVANHRSHIDTPIILASLPRRLRHHTVVGAAADYFYRNRLLATVVSFIFNTVPLDRKGGGTEKLAMAHVDKLLDKGWSLLLYPEGTRSRSGGQGRVRRGAAVLAERHNMPIVPIRVSGTRAAMPPGRFWPKRIQGLFFTKRHPVSISFGEPISPNEDATIVVEKLAKFFTASENSAGVKSNGAKNGRFTRLSGQRSAVRRR